MLWIFGGLVIASLVIFGFIREAFVDAKLYRELKPQLDMLESQKIEFTKEQEEAHVRLQSQKIEFGEEKEKMYSDIEKITRQRSMGFPWLAEAYADYFSLRDDHTIDYLLNKAHPARTAAETVREVKEEKRELLKQNRVLTYKLHYLEKILPWVSEIISDNEEEIPIHVDVDVTDNNEDRVRDFLTPEEYVSLPSIERNQRALDRYLKKRNKSKWAVGRDYEMYVGHLFSKKGYHVYYKGIIDGFDDLGRDIIATKGGEVCIIQCKYWAQYKEIHEKHVFQLFGTTMEYWMRHFKGGKKQGGFEEFSCMLNEQKLRPIFFTSTNLSNRAREMAKALSIEIIEGEPLGEFPRIKCNINSGESGIETKIYHLPMDQQYDRTIIGNRAGEFFAFTVQEAEDAGFRRAFRYRF